MALDEPLPTCAGAAPELARLVGAPAAAGGDPRPLLQQWQAGLPRQMISTAFETGIGQRFVEHLAALQAQGPTP